MFKNSVNGQNCSENSKQKTAGPVFFNSKRMKFLKRGVVGITCAALIVTSASVMMTQSSGYTVYYEGESVGFVDNPEVVTENIEDISSAISDKKEGEANVQEESFSFEKSVKPFYVKEDVDEIAESATEKCDIMVNSYNIYVDGQCVAQDSSMDNYELAVENIKNRYMEEHPDENFETIDFTQTVEVEVTEDVKANTMTEEEMEMLLGALLTVKTTEYVVEETITPYEIIYKPTNEIDAGTTVIETNGVEGVTETVRFVEKNDGIEVSSEEISTEVKVEKVDQVILMGTNGISFNESGMINPTIGVLTSKMGPRWGRIHKGIDIGGAHNEPIMAALPGTVIVSGYNTGGYGNMVKIQHENGLITLYGHMNELKVEAGTWVEAGDIIGLMGSTGRSTGTHLHFEVILDGENLDPLEFVEY